MSLTVDGRPSSTRRRLTYESPSLRLARGLSALYVHQLDAMCQYVISLHARLKPGVSTSSLMDEVDRVLTTSLDDSEAVVPVHAFEDLFGIYRMQAAPPAGEGIALRYFIQLPLPYPRLGMPVQIAVKPTLHDMYDVQVYHTVCWARPCHDRQLIVT
jgi:hypothetical protein